MSRALVVFHGHGTGWLSRFLKPGFRHCFAVLEREGYWILFDPRPDGVDIRVIAPAAADVAGFYRGQGYTVVTVAADKSGRGGWPRFRLPLMPVTCVAAVKRVVGVRRISGMTPWRFFAALRNSS